MQERAGGRHPQPVLPDLRRRALDQRGLLLEIRPPHVATVDHTRRQDAPRPFRPRGEQRIELCRRANEVDMQALDRQGQSRREIVAEAGEIRSDQQLRLPGPLRELFVRFQERGSLPVAAIERQHRFVELDPGRSC